MEIIEVPSPNYNLGRSGYTPEAIVIHIMEGSLSATDNWFQSISSQVSAHYGIGLKGAVHRYVKESNTAWHAGRVHSPSWNLIKPASGGLFINPNYYTIGIEHEGEDDTNWTEAMYNTSSLLIKELCSRWKIPLDRQHIIGHHEIYSLKTCPGSKVDINKLISLAKGIAAPFPVTPAQLIMQNGKVTTLHTLNIRSKPSTSNIPVNMVKPNVQLAYDGYTNFGESINGNTRWYFTTEGNWFSSEFVK